MKKILSLVLAMGLMVSLAGCSSQQASAAPAPAKADPIKMGKVDYAAHGTKGFAIAVVAVQGDKIVGAYVDDYQTMSKATTKAVPNSDKDFGKTFADPTLVLGSKKTNTEAYSANMAKSGGSTQPWDKNMAAIEKYAVGKTVAELEATLKNTPKEKMPVDTISGSTLTDSYGYLSAIVEAAKVAK